MDTTLSSKRGHVLLCAGEFGPLWRVTKGVYRLDRIGFDGTSLVQLALPGDLLGVEALCSAPYAYNVTAITHAAADVQVVGQDLSHFSAVAQGYLQQQRCMYDMMQMRSGPVADRLAYFLKLLARRAEICPRELDRRNLPIHKEIAAILDTATETVCRELNAFIPARVYQRPARQGWMGGAELAMTA